MLFLSKGLYGNRPRTHIRVYEMEPDWWFVEVCCWTLEVTASRACIKAYTRRAVVAMVLATVVVFGADGMAEAVAPLKAGAVALFSDYSNEGVSQ